MFNKSEATPYDLVFSIVFGNLYISFKSKTNRTNSPTPGKRAMQEETSEAPVSPLFKTEFCAIWGMYKTKAQLVFKYVMQ